MGLAGFCLLPWYVQEDGFWGFEWLTDGYPFDPDYAPALFLIWQGEKLWLSPLVLWLVMPLASVFWTSGDTHSRALRQANVLLVAGVAGLFWLAAQGYGIGLRGWNFDALTQLFGPLEDRQFGMGAGALFVAATFLFFLTTGIAGRGANQRRCICGRGNRLCHRHGGRVHLFPNSANAVECLAGQ